MPDKYNVALKEFSNPVRYEISEDMSLLKVLTYWYEKRPEKIIFKKFIDNNWIDISNKSFMEEMLNLVKALKATGIKPGDRIGIMSNTRYEWTLIDYAIMFCEAISVPIYPTSSVKQIEWIVEDSGLKYCFLENENLLKTVKQSKNLSEINFQLIDSSINNLESFIQSGTKSSISNTDILKNSKNIKASDIATIIYTSGTTGNPKGCCITHKNFLSEARFALCCSLNKILTKEGSSTLMFLPLSHVLARSLLFMAIEGGSIVGHLGDSKKLIETFPVFKPNFVIAVPRVFEKIYAGLDSKASSFIKSKIFKNAYATAVEYSQTIDSKKTISNNLKKRHSRYDSLVYKKIREALGNELEAVCLGGAPISAELVHFFIGAGVNIYEGYGLTEAAACIAINTPEFLKVGTCGKIFDGNSVKISEEGEILIKGDNLFKEYWHNPKSTEDSFVDGWYKTGDKGELSDEGFLKITGRIKDIIITAGGKNVSPAILEDSINSSLLISQSIVIGDKKPFIAVLLTLDEEQLDKWKQMNNISKSTDFQNSIKEPKLQKEIETIIQKANERVSKAESIKKYFIIENEFSEEDGTLTPSLKIKRHEVYKKYSNVIEEIYSSKRI